MTTKSIFKTGNIYRINIKPIRDTCIEGMFYEKVFVEKRLKILLPFIVKNKLQFPKKGEDFLILFMGIQEEYPEYYRFIYNGKILYTKKSGYRSLFDRKYCSVKMVRVSNKNK